MVIIVILVVISIIMIMINIIFSLSREPRLNVRPTHAAFRFMKYRYTPFILSAAGKSLVLLGTAGLLTVGIWGATEVCDLNNCPRSMQTVVRFIRHPEGASIPLWSDVHANLTHLHAFPTCDVRMTTPLS